MIAFLLLIILGNATVQGMSFDTIEKTYKDFTKSLRDKRLDLSKELSTQRNDIARANQGIKAQKDKLKKNADDKKLLESQIELIKQQLKKLADQEASLTEELKKAQALVNKLNISTISSLPPRQQAIKNEIEKLNAFNKDVDAQTSMQSNRDKIKSVRAPVETELKNLKVTLDDADKLIAFTKGTQGI